MGLDILPFIFNCPQNALSPPGTWLKMTANRYTTVESAANIDGLTFIFLHGIGAHKEQWEVVIAEMFNLQQDKPPHLRMREAWALDRPNHGDAAVLNSEELLRNRRQGSPASEWAEAVGAFLRSTRLKGHRIVQVAHSAAPTRYIDLSSVSIAGIIVVAPAMLAPETYYRYIEPIALGLSAPAHTEHGLIETADGSGKPSASPDTDSQFGAIDQISKICRLIPFHVVWGIKDHLIPQLSRGSISDRSQGRIAASETPTELAGVVSRLCDGISVVRDLRGQARL
ncbi:CN hydrolase domain-containing protein [Favolaschia claudopus]|uniref:CN hydrolase domain-containing protein n=1 Tax=Favolaschia claudopus TaxID=2862362 RepID=A0AAW0DGH6_9AGAR